MYRVQILYVSIVAYFSGKEFILLLLLEFLRKGRFIFASACSFRNEDGAEIKITVSRKTNSN